MPSEWAKTETERLFDEASKHARTVAPGDDVIAGVDRLGARLRWLRENLPAALDDARQRNPE